MEFVGTLHWDSFVQEAKHSCIDAANALCGAVDAEDVDVENVPPEKPFDSDEAMMRALANVPIDRLAGQPQPDNGVLRFWQTRRQHEYRRTRKGQYQYTLADQSGRKLFDQAKPHGRRWL